MRPFTGLFLASIPLWLGGCALPVEIAVASYAADGGLMLLTDKTSNDHMLSLVAGRDCAMWRLIKGRAICSDYKPGEENPYDVDYDAAHREVGEGGLVVAYTASRHGGRLLTDQEAAEAVRARPVMSASARPPGAVPAAPAEQAANPAAPRRTVELPDVTLASTGLPPAPPASTTAPARKPVTLASATRARAKPVAMAGRKPSPSVAGRPAAARAPLATQARRKPVPVPVDEPPHSVVPATTISMAVTPPDVAR